MGLCLENGALHMDGAVHGGWALHRDLCTVQTLHTT